MTNQDTCAVVMGTLQQLVHSGYVVRLKQLAGNGQREMEVGGWAGSRYFLRRKLGELGIGGEWPAADLHHGAAEPGGDSPDMAQNIKPNGVFVYSVVDLALISSRLSSPSLWNSLRPPS